MQLRQQIAALVAKSRVSIDLYTSNVLTELFWIVFAETSPHAKSVTRCDPAVPLGSNSRSHQASASPAAESTAGQTGSAAGFTRGRQSGEHDWPAWHRGGEAG